MCATFGVWIYTPHLAEFGVDTAAEKINDEALGNESGEGLKVLEKRESVTNVVYQVLLQSASTTGSAVARSWPFGKEFRP
jgi:hypothetical protein